MAYLNYFHGRDKPNIKNLALVKIGQMLYGMIKISGISITGYGPQARGRVGDSCGNECV